MKLLSLVLILGFTANGAHASSEKFLDGKNFVNCFEAAVNNTIKDYKTVISKKDSTEKLPTELNEQVSSEIVITKGDTNRLCSEMSKEAKSKISTEFFEEYNGNMIPYEAEDIMMATVGDLIDALKDKVNCYNPYKAVTKSNGHEIKAPFLLSKITDSRNAQLTKDALALMLSQELSEEDLDKPISEFNINFCKTI